MTTTQTVRRVGEPQPFLIRGEMTNVVIQRGEGKGIYDLTFRVNAMPCEITLSRPVLCNLSSGQPNYNDFKQQCREILLVEIENDQTEWCAMIYDAMPGGA